MRLRRRDEMTGVSGVVGSAKPLVAELHILGKRVRHAFEQMRGLTQTVQRGARIGLLFL